MKIAYIGSMCDTFVINELQAHEEAGWQVLPLASSKPCPIEILSEVMDKWGKRAVYRSDVGFLVLVGLTLREMITQPLQFSRLCLWFISLFFHSPVEFAKALYELPTACYYISHCRRFGVRHIHVHFASRSLSLGLILAILASLPVSCTVHAFDIFTRSPRSLRYRLNQCKFIAAVSRFNIEYLEKTCGKSVADLCHLVHCGIDVDKFKSVPRRPQPGRIICVCRLFAKKGLEFAIRACAKLRDNNVGFLFEIVGNGPEYNRLKKLIGQLRLEDNVQLLGAKPNDQLAGFFSKACAFLMPCIKMSDGNMDGIPVAMMEAMACHVPVVSTSISGIPELVENDVTGYLVRDKDEDALAEVLEKLLGNMDKIKQFGKAGSKRVLKEFSIHKNAAKLRELIES
ncbi:MAG: glycosyltransferase [Planctomycetota bacterium]|nr:MAG: glycosyltransferase [Planctomycetota bacterium]